MAARALDYWNLICVLLADKPNEVILTENEEMLYQRYLAEPNPKKKPNQFLTPDERITKLRKVLDEHEEQLRMDKIAQDSLLCFGPWSFNGWW